VNGWLLGFLLPVGEEEKLSLLALTYHREGQWDQYHRTLEQRDQVAQASPLRIGDQTFAGITDVDDPTAWVLEVLSPSGEYHWLPWREIASLQTTPPARPLDYLWGQCQVKLRSGQELFLFANVLYPSRGPQEDRYLLGRETTWVGDQQQGYLACGKKLFQLEPDQELTWHELGLVEFT